MSKKKNCKTQVKKKNKKISWTCYEVQEMLKMDEDATARTTTVKNTSRIRSNGIQFDKLRWTIPLP